MAHTSSRSKLYFPFCWKRDRKKLCILYIPNWLSKTLLWKTADFFFFNIPTGKTTLVAINSPKGTSITFQVIRNNVYLIRESFLCKVLSHFLGALSFLAFQPRSPPSHFTPVTKKFSFHLCPCFYSLPSSAPFFLP